MIWPHNWFLIVSFHNAGILFAYIWCRLRLRMNPSSVIENGRKTRVVPEIRRCVSADAFVRNSASFSRIFLKELKKARWFSFRGKSNKEAVPAYTFGFVVSQTIKRFLKTKRNQQPLLACTWIHSPENENQKVSSASAGRANHVEHRVKTTASKFNKTMVPS